MKWGGKVHISLHMFNYKWTSEISFSAWRFLEDIWMTFSFLLCAQLEWKWAMLRMRHAHLMKYVACMVSRNISLQYREAYNWELDNDIIRQKMEQHSSFQLRYPQFTQTQPSLLFFYHVQIKLLLKNDYLAFATRILNHI